MNFSKYFLQTLSPSSSRISSVIKQIVTNTLLIAHEKNNKSLTFQQ